MIRWLLWPVLLPFRLAYYMYCRVRNVRRVRPLLPHSVPDRFTMHRTSGWAAMLVPQKEAHYLDYLLFLRILARTDGPRHIVLRIPEMHCAWSEVEELARRFDAVRAGGKSITAFLEGGNLKSMYLAAAADWRLSAPHADFLCARPAAEPLFVKKALVRLGVDVEVLTAGKYKSAGELFTRTNLSIPAREALESMLGDIHRDIDARLSSAPGLTDRSARALSRLVRQRALLNAEELLENGFLCEVIPSSLLEAREALRLQPALPGARVDAEETIELPSPETVRKLMVSEGALIGRARRARFRPVRPGPRPMVAVVSLAGNMVNGRRGDAPRPEIIATAAYQDLFESLREGPEEAVFVHINSPGGTSSGSELLYQSIRSLGEQKPVFAVLGPVAASGGYYIALAAQKIFAANNTITGSVGVYAMHASFGRLYRRLGVGRERVYFDPTQDILSESAPLSPQARALMRSHVARTYDLFLQRVAEGRKMSVRDVRRHAEGRVWTGAAFRKSGHLDEALDPLAAIEWYRDQRGYADHVQIQLNFYPDIRTDLRSLLNRLPFGIGSSAIASSLLLPDGLRKAISFYRPLLEEEPSVVMAHWPLELLFRGL